VGKIEDLVYSDEDNKAVEQWVRANIATTWHSLGTLAMKPREKGGVVDPKLNVYGVENLKVAGRSPHYGCGPFRRSQWITNVHFASLARSVHLSGQWCVISFDPSASESG
jgi:hypothetical protein